MSWQYSFTLYGVYNSYYLNSIGQNNFNQFWIIAECLQTSIWDLRIPINFDRKVYIKKDLDLSCGEGQEHFVLKILVTNAYSAFVSDKLFERLNISSIKKGWRLKLFCNGCQKYRVLCTSSLWKVYTSFQIYVLKIIQI